MFKFQELDQRYFDTLLEDFIAVTDMFITFKLKILELLIN